MGHGSLRARIILANPGVLSANVVLIVYSICNIKHTDGVLGSVCLLDQVEFHIHYSSYIILSRLGHVFI